MNQYRRDSLFIERIKEDLPIPYDPIPKLN